jgi:hypothetical protein
MHPQLLAVGLDTAGALGGRCSSSLVHPRACGHYHLGGDIYGARVVPTELVGSPT